jgi:hypothetical protein
MKKSVALVLSLIILMLLSSCTVDFNRDRWPVAYPNTKWVSTNPDMYFEVKENIDNGNIGEMRINKKVIPIKLVFDHGRGVYIVNNDVFIKTNSTYDSNLISGSCKFSRTKFIVNIDKISKDISIDPSIKEIIFNRQ